MDILKFKLPLKVYLPKPVEKNGYLIMTYKRYEYWSKEGKVWTDWFSWNSDLKPELQMDDRRIFCRLRNEYKEVN